MFDLFLPTAQFAVLSIPLPELGQDASLTGSEAPNPPPKPPAK
ncbi:MAG: hypothetical protein RL748_4338 [Pseudomonadota bacterium]|jgi:hypothetical protein